LFFATETRLRNDVPQLTSDVTEKQTCFDFTAGGGIDYHFQKHWAARATADYIRTYFSNVNQNNVRVSVGLTYRWNQSPVF
jgi:opacity protein-like surface antigen